MTTFRDLKTIADTFITIIDDRIEILIFISHRLIYRDLLAIIDIYYFNFEFF